MPSFLYSQLFIRLPYPTTPLPHQTIIVTGSNIGLGLEAARHFTRLHAAKVILAVRDLAKGDAAAKSIEQSTHRPGVVEVWPLDLSSAESVRQFVKRAEGLERVDALVENAGIATREWRVVEGAESTLMVNVFGTFLLAVMMLPKMRETARSFNVSPRLVVVSSEVHGWAKFEERNAKGILEALNDKSTTNMGERYPVTKLLEILYGRELASRANPSSNKSSPTVIINFLNPGLCHSSLSRESPFYLEILKFFLARSTEHGSRSLVHAATAGGETNGCYLSDCAVADPAPIVLGEEGAKLQKKVWEEISAKLEEIEPGVMRNV
ncbi:hypothetical protein MMC21_008117 [Puttea exsequens]|nr:hypothetical protein [Puttea exsequens]